MGGEDSLYYPEPPPRRDRVRDEHGCLYYGCLIAVVLTAVVAVVAVVATFYAYRFVSRTVEQYTDTVPMALPVTKLPEPELKALKDRVQDFKKATEEGRAETLTLTSDEVNALLESEPQFAGKFALTIDQDKLKGQMSYPFDLPHFGRRYVNGKATFRVSLEDGTCKFTSRISRSRASPCPRTS